MAKFSSVELFEQRGHAAVGAPCGLPVRPVMVFAIVFFALLTVPLQISAASTLSRVQAEEIEQQQQEEQKQQLQDADQLFALANPEAMVVSVPRLAHLLSGANLGAGKRSNQQQRRLSGFMPMRGRKDGRDLELELARENAQHQQQQHQQDLRELDEPEQAILRLALEALASERRHRDTRAAMDNGDQPIGLPLARQLESAGWPYAAPRSMMLMEAKPRRAFHPMRGKRS